ncbi:MAG: hypothetical protein V7636_1255, partial [Actinomycetota bacterium]
MHLWTRTCQIDVLHGPEAFAFAADTAERASSATGLEVVPWTAICGVAPGAVVFSAQVESEERIAEALATLADDGGYRRRTEGAASGFGSGPSTDAIGEVLIAAGPGGTDGSFASVVVTRSASERAADATTWGVDALEHAAKVTGLDSCFVRRIDRSDAATFLWIAVAETMDEIDCAAAALAADAGHLARVDDGRSLFVPGTASQR